MPLVLDLVRYDSDSDYVGYNLVVRYGGETEYYPFAIEDRTFCCEDYGVEVDKDGIEGIRDKRLVSITSSSLKGYEENAECFTIEVEDGSTLDITIFNNHNGYYEHSYRATYFRDGEFRVDEDAL